MACFDNLTAKQQLAITALLQQPTVAEAAQAAGCGERTLYRWLQERTFQRAYREARRQAVNQALTQLQRLAGEAVLTLSQILRDPDSSSNSKVSAAKLIFDYGVKDNLEERLQELEERLQELDLKKGGQEAWQRAAVVTNSSESE